MRALQVFAGAAARRALAQQRLQPQQVVMVPAAAGGPKGLVLTPLDRYMFGHWLPRGDHEVQLLGASIGAWRMAAACRQDPVAAIEHLCADYIDQHYPHAPGRRPTAASVSERFGATLSRHLAGHEVQILGHPRYRLHVLVSRGRGLLRQEGRWRTPLGYGLAWLGNLLSRRALGHALERVVLSDPRSPLPLLLDDLRSRRVDLSPANLQAAVLASCAIPFWLQSVKELPGAPPGAYWDGGITDYHLRLRYDTLPAGLVLYPHFQPQLVPGWLDKPWRHRHRATPALDRVVVLAPHPQWVARLPLGKLPDRSDFQHFGDDLAGRQRAWRRVVAESQRLADEFAAWVDGALDLPVQALV